MEDKTYPPERRDRERICKQPNRNKSRTFIQRLKSTNQVPQTGWFRMSLDVSTTKLQMIIPYLNSKGDQDMCRQGEGIAEVNVIQFNIVYSIYG